VVVITRRGRSVARLIRESDGEAGSAVELLRELHNQKP
jgi:antitoxin (DNA-binding transcriptional repressor) of toxin-antitoxin stability system